MARILGIDLPNKRSEVALTYIYGIGKSSARKILAQIKVDFNMRANDLSEENVNAIRTIIEKNYKVEGDLKLEVRSSIKRLIEINSYRGVRHRKGLPVRGQKTKTNARTRKGKRK